jgi:hypothetical protein
MRENAVYRYLARLGQAFLRAKRIKAPAISRAQQVRGGEDAVASTRDASATQSCVPAFGSHSLKQRNSRVASRVPGYFLNLLTDSRRSQGRGCGVGRGRGVGVGLAVAVGVAEGVIVAVAVGVADGGGVIVAVAVGVGLACGQLKISIDATGTPVTS